MAAIAYHPALKNQPLIAIGMSRVSLLIQADNYSIETQNHKLIGLGQKYGFEIPDGFLLDDEGYSGTNLNRPAILRALRMIKAGEANAVVFPYVDRFARTVEGGLAMIRQFREAGAKVCFGEFGWVEDNVQTKILITMLLAIAETQRDSIVEKSVSCVATKISKGLAHGGRSPFGWHFVTALEIAADALNKGLPVPGGKPQNVHRPVPEDIGTLRLMAQLVLSGESAKGLCRELLARGVKSPLGKTRWNPTTAAKILHDLCYSTGIWHYGKRKGVAPKKLRKPEAIRRTLKSSWQLRPESEWLPQTLAGGPLWTAEEQQAIIAALERNRMVKVGKPAAEDGFEAILKQMMVCKRTMASGEICGKAVVPKQKSTPAGRRCWYVCSHRDRMTNEHLCSRHHAKAQVVEEAVWEATRKAVMEDLDDLVARYRDEICSTVDAGELARLKAEEQRLLRKKEEARDRELHADDPDDKRYYAGQLSEFKGQLALVRRRVQSFTEETAIVEVDSAAIREEVGAAWKTKVRSERREVLVGLIRLIEWIADDEVVITLRIPRKSASRGANGERGVPHVDHYIPLKINVKVAA